MAAIELARFEQAEGKAWRHLYVLVVLLGFALVSSGRRVLAILDGQTPSGLEGVFLVVFGLFLFAALSAGIVSVCNFRVALTMEAPLDRSIEEFAIANSLERLQLELGREFFRSAAENRRVSDSKFHLLVWNFRLLISALTMGVLLGFLFLLLPRGSS